MYIIMLTVGAPMVMVNSTTATTISLSWSSAGSLVDSYEVTWERDTSGECPDEDEGSTTITDGSTSYTITGLEEDSSYIITVNATNAAGSAISVSVTEKTEEAGEGLTSMVLKKHGYEATVRHDCIIICIISFSQPHLPLPLLSVHLM